MKKSISILLSIVALIIGLLGGWFVTAHFYNNWIENYMRTAAYVDLAKRYRVLNELRAGNTNAAAATSEIYMDGDILAFGSFFRDVPAAKRSPEDVRLLRQIQEYRLTYPRSPTNYSDVDKDVADILALVSTNQSR